MRKEKTPEDKAAYEAKRAAQRRQWALAHPEQTRRYGRDFYKRNQEKRKSYSREYNRQHREERRAYSREYYRRKKAENPNYVRELNERDKARRLAKGLMPAPRRLPKTEEERRLAWWQYYMENRVKLCRQKLTVYSYKSMAEIKSRIPDRVEEYLRAYPFEEFGDRLIRSTLLRRFSIRPRQAEYEDCYEAGILAYLYSIHRCADMACDYTVPYIRKMIRIYIICALVVYYDSRDLCRRNHFLEIRLDDEEETGRRY